MDAPQGTSDEHITVVENLLHIPCTNPNGEILVTNSEMQNMVAKGGGEDLAKSFNFPFLGSIPLDSSLTQSLEDGQALMDLFPDSPTLTAVNIINSNLLQMESNGDQTEL